MNILGLQINVDRSPSAKVKWTRRAGILGLANIVVLGGGIAVAAWTVTGAGSGVGKAGTSTALSTVTATTTSLGLLYPGGNPGDLKVTFDNPNPFPVTITSVTAGSAITATGGTGTCTTTGVTFTAPTSPSISIVAKSGGVDGTTTTTFINALSMTNASQDGCQGATFTVPINFTGASG